VHRRCGWSVDHLNPAGTGFWARPSRGAGRVAVIDDDSRPGTLHRIGVPRRRGRCWSESIASSDEGWGTPRPATAPPSSRRGSRPRTPHRSRARLHTSEGVGARRAPSTPIAVRPAPRSVYTRPGACQRRADDRPANLMDGLQLADDGRGGTMEGTLSLNAPHSSARYPRAIQGLGRPAPRSSAEPHLQRLGASLTRRCAGNRHADHVHGAPRLSTHPGVSPRHPDDQHEVPSPQRRAPPPEARS